jgi:hypothetical protein
VDNRLEGMILQRKGSARISDINQSTQYRDEIIWRTGVLRWEKHNCDKERGKQYFTASTPDTNKLSQGDSSQRKVNQQEESWKTAQKEVEQQRCLKVVGLSKVIMW